MGKGGGGSTTVQTQEIPDFVKNMVTESFDIAKGFNPSSNVVPGVAGFTPTQTTAQNLITGLATGNPFSASKSVVDDVLTGQFNISDPLQRVLDDTLSKTVDNVTSQYSAGGRLGSDAFGTALGEGIASGVAPTLASALDTDAARKLSAVGLAPMLANADLGLFGALAGVGAEERALDQALLNLPAAQVSADNAATQQRINNILAAVGGSPVPMTTTQDVTKQVSAGDQVAGTVATLAALASLSDRRLKVDIKKIGTHSTGLNVYEWEWNAKAFVLGLDKHPRKGFIAQEVQKVFPEAVVEGSHGYLMIDYSKIKEVA
tara:strand:- start:2453 stop:3406 length:954 start_codon:yes stop_codon:yes gene_type:complete